MSGAAISMPRAGRERGLHLDPVLIGIVMSILLFGLVMVTSASISIAAHEGGDPFVYVRSQLLLALGGVTVAVILCGVPTSLMQKYSTVLLGLAGLMLVLVLVPGIGHEVNGSRRWLRLAGFNLQASEVARILVLSWIAAYAVRREKELRESLSGLALPLAVTAGFCLALLLEPLRRGHGAVRDGIRAAVPCRRSAALGGAVRSAGRRGIRCAAGIGKLPPAAAHLIHGSLVTCLRQWFSADAVADRHRPRPVVRRRPGRERAETALSARSAHGLPVRRAGRGTGARRRAPDAAAVPGAGLACTADRATGCGIGPEIPVLSCSRLRAVGGHAGADQYSREHGRAAHEGADAAADELWPQQPAGDAGLARRGDAHPPRGQRGGARRGQRHATRCRSRRMNTRPVLIMAGGTGGHVFPALALARLLRSHSREVIWLGTRRGLEARLVPADGFPIEWLSASGLRGKGVLSLLRAPFMLLRSLWEALRIVRRHRPAVVVGLGGFVTGPGGLAAWLCRRPLLIHEQNAVAGFTNRCLAPLAREVLTAFPAAFAGSPKARLIGNPVRVEIASLPEPAVRFAD